MARTVKPPRLKPGDTIAIIAPAGPPDKERLLLGAKRIEQLGYRVYIHPQCFIRRGYLAGDDKLRAETLMEVFADDRYRAIFCARGGYGCQRIIDHLDLDFIRKNNKIFVGFSDLTLLLHAFSKNGFVTFHGPMPAINFAGSQYRYSLNNLFQLLTGHNSALALKNPEKSRPIKTFYKGKVEGILTGGNLTLLDKLIGTPFIPSFKDKIVFIEDINEEPYRLDGYLAHLFMTTDIARAAGFIFGPFYKCRIKKKTSVSLTLTQILDDYFRGLKVPIISNVACGHGNMAITLPIGIRAAINAGKRTLTILESAVK